MPFTSFFPQSRISDALTELQKKFGDARTSLLRIRADRVRLARTGWRPRVPSETKLIRAAEWRTEAAPMAGETVDFDLESRFVPTEAAYAELVRELDRAGSAGKTARVFLRGLELDEPRFSIAGRPIAAAFFDLALALSRGPGAIVVLPKVDGYLEARFWAEVVRSFELSLGLPRDSTRFEVSIETLGGAVEAEEILFELKESAVGIRYDVRLDRFDALRLDSGAPNLPREDFTGDPWTGLEIATRTEALETLARKRGVRLSLRPDGGPIREAASAETGETPAFSLDRLRAMASFAFGFLKEWYEGTPTPGGRDWTDFELARALLWTAIHSGFLREENYEAWREEFGPQPFEGGSADDAAIRTLDPLVRTAIFPDSAKTLAFSILLEREKARSVSSLRLA
ncbi:MAG: hypothetical protein JST04_10920 [Bdellovibrionales bacterium]|nr:hypothetical protein [Bdellovibrionales bacterium]